MAMAPLRIEDLCFSWPGGRVALEPVLSVDPQAGPVDAGGQQRQRQEHPAAADRRPADAQRRTCH